MAHPSPLQAFHEDADAQMLAFGHTPVVAMHDVVETEYGRLRNRAAIMDCPHRTLVELAGADRLAFLHRLVSNDVASLKSGEGMRAFLLTAKGRIIADLIVLHGEDRTLIDLDAADAAALCAELDKLLFGEDVQIVDRSDACHRLSLHGPEAAELLDALSPASLAGGGASFSHQQATLAGADATVYRHDVCGVGGHHLWLAVADVERVWRTVVPTDPQHERAKPLGWLAFNIARLEAGTPLFHVDFGPDSLPGETGLLGEAVSFTKGCYRGQEVVATMKDRGHPSKLLVRWKAVGDDLPVAGAPVYADAESTDPIGAITSSAPSPLLSGRPIGLAMVKWGSHEAGGELFAAAEGGKAAIHVVGEPFV